MPVRRNPKKKQLLALFLLVPASLVLTGCGASSPDATSGSAEPTVGPPGPTPVGTATEPPTAPPPTAPPTTAARTPTVRSVTSPVSPGSNATASFTTAANAACLITVTYNSGPSNASGLGAKTADAHGAVSWTWKVGSRTAAGTYAISVDCTPGGSVQAQFTVA